MRRLNKFTALIVAGVISCTSPMMVMASDSGSVMSQAEEILKDNEVGSLASDPDKVGDIIVYVKGLFDSNQITDDEISQGIDEAADHFGVSLNEDDKSSLVNIISKFRGIEMSDDQIKGYVSDAYSTLKDMGVTKSDVKNIFEKAVEFIKEKLSDVLEAGIAEDLETIINTVESVKTADFKMSFDPTLVRGMSYYTGPIFEISIGGSVGGGGRYDEMIGKFTGNNTCACGFSIGFERIVMLLLERGYEIPTKNGKKAYLIEKNMPADKLLNILKQATEERSAGTQINISIMKKNKKFQKDQLAADGYTEYVEFFNRD